VRRERPICQALGTAAAVQTESPTGRAKNATTSTAARCEVPLLRQRWLSIRQAQVPRGLISLYGRDTLQGALASPSRKPRCLRSLGGVREWKLDELD